MKKQKYIAETEFEKTEFADLIREIGEIEDEQLSPDFDDKLYGNISRIKLKKPIRLRLAAWFSPSPQRGFRLTWAYGAAFSLLLVSGALLILFRNDSKTLPPKKQAVITDTASAPAPQKNYAAKSDLKEKKKELGNIAEETINKEILLKVNEKMNYGFSSNKLTMEQLVKIMSTPDYKRKVEHLSRIKNVTVIDKVNIIIEIITR